MNGVITARQAKQITGGRTPLVLVELEDAVKALDACLAIDDAKCWGDYADALAAWAKVHLGGRRREMQLLLELVNP